MPRRGAKHDARPRAKRRSPLFAWLRRRLGLLATAALCGVVALIGYLIYLDRVVTATFEGRRWSVPAVVYAAPLEIHAGARLSITDVAAELARLGYEQRANDQIAGTYQRRQDSLTVHLRAFRFMERMRGSQHIEIKFHDQRITSVHDVLGRPIPLLRLDPVIIGSFFPSHGEDRLVLVPDQVPVLLTEGLKAVEDRRFDSHAGFDVAGILRAIWVNVKSAEFKQGGSTLTQQLVKSYFLDNRRTIVRKLREIAMAIILEIRFTKIDLLNAYINEIYLGQDGARAIHGFGLGAQFYFNRPLEELSTAEIATLIAVIRGPSYYDPFRHPQRTQARRNRVLDIMAEYAILESDATRAAQASALGVVQGARRGGAYYPAFMDLVRQNLAELSVEDLTSKGLRVFTTLNPRTQDAAEGALAKTLRHLESERGRHLRELQAAVVITNTQTGEVQALIGARRSGDDGFNRALHARRPIGSLLKPVIYLAALENGHHLANIIDDVPITIQLPNQASWQPQNFDKKTRGPVPLVRALGDSLNLATVSLGMRLGVDTVAARLDALTQRRTSNRYPSLLLGAESLTPIEVAGLYGTFASGGFRMPAKAVVAVLDEPGTTIAHHRFTMEQNVDRPANEALNTALGIVMRKGTGKSSRFSNSGVAGKTGTSNDYRDSWFAGFDNAQLAVVWLGNDDYSETGLTGAAGALRVWDNIMTQLNVEPIAPVTAQLTSIEYTSGYQAHADCADVVEVPLPQGTALQRKPGCGITPHSASKRIRR